MRRVLMAKSLEDAGIALEDVAEEGFRPAAIERVLRVQGDSTRRIAEAGAAWWNSEVMEPAIAADGASEGISNADLTARIAPVMEEAVLAMYHLSKREPGPPTSSKASKS
jgi:hypothetical protein